MESKRKANNHSADADDRSNKRRKLADIDLSKGETRESTTAYGLAFLEQIRRTQDKNGRLVATYFEQLLPRAENAEYYKKTRLPISLQTIEEKLNKGAFENLAEVESDFKRMILNAKDFYPRSTPIFDDAERVRKALSNYMTKTNPAYSTRGYQAVPTPLPPEVEEEEEAEEEKEEEEKEEKEGGEEKEEVGENDGDGNEEMEDKEEDGEEKEEGGEEVDGDEEKAETGNAEGEDPEGEAEVEEEVEGEEDGEKEEEEEGDEDAEGEEEKPEDPPAEDDKDGNAQDEEMEVEAEQEEEEGGEEEDEPRSRRKSIILKRKGPSRTAKTVAPVAQPDPEYEDVSYKGLTFQQAQEKIVEELLRHHEPEYDDPYFEAFINLPPRALRDYYKVISDPISLKKLQKLVKGIHGRGGGTVFTGTSELKSWSAFEDKAKLLWTNAYFYNEEGSEIYLLAQDLERQFYKHFNKAQAAVAEPAQPKIKLKIGQVAETPNSKKITIHVGGRGGSVESPITQMAASTEPVNDVNVQASANANTNATNNVSNGIAMARTGSSNLDAARSVSQTAVSPSPSAHAHMSGVKEESVQASPAASATTPVPMAAPTMVRPPLPPVPSQPAQETPLNGLFEQRRFRGPGKGSQDALISQLRIQSHPSPQNDRPMVLTVLPNAKEMHQSATINLSPHQSRVFIVASLPHFLQDRQYSLWTLMDKQPLKQCLVPIPGQQLQERAFDVMLHPGLNIIETHLIAAIPRSEREPGGPEVELEVFTILVNVTRI